VSLSTHSRTHTDWGLSRSFKLQQMHGMYRKVVRGRLPSYSPQELSNGVRGNVGCKSWVEFNCVSYRLCLTRTERETPINVYRFFQTLFFCDKVSVRVKGVEISLTSVCLNRRSCKFLYVECTMNKIIFFARHEDIFVGWRYISTSS